MTKKILSLILAAMIVTASGCNNSQKAQQTTENTAPVSDVMDYEMYIEDLDYYMNQYVQSDSSAKEAFGTQDADSTKKHLGNVIDALNSLGDIIYPPNLEEIHSELLSAAELEKKVAECNIELTSYIGISNELSDENRNSFNALNAKAAEILTEIEEKGNVLDAWRNAKNAAFSYLPNGEYKAYVLNLETLWNKYVAEFDKLYEVFFNGAEGDALVVCENCEETLSAIENMEVPEQVKPYHDDVIAALSKEREYCQAVKTIRELNIEYQGVAVEDLPDDIWEQVNECSEIIDNYFNEENPDYDAAYNAVIAAGEFAEAQIK